MGADLSNTDTYDFLSDSSDNLDDTLTRHQIDHIKSNVAWLMVLRLRSSGKTIEMQIDEDIVLGRGGKGNPNQMIDLQDYDAMQLGVSRRHAIIRTHEKNLIVRDLSSTNGTFINGYRLPVGADYPLRTGDLLEVGKLALRVELAVPSS
jgi:hypothetical protein